MLYTIKENKNGRPVLSLRGTRTAPPHLVWGERGGGEGKVRCKWGEVKEGGSDRMALHDYRHAPHHASSPFESWGVGHGQE